MKNIEKTSIAIAFVIAAILLIIKLQSPSTSTNTKSPKTDLLENNSTIEELGNVNWFRNIKEARALATQHSKPILILIGDTNTCSNCKRFGKEVLSNKGIVDAIEYNFIPVAFLNASEIKNTDLLQVVKESDTSNPVVTIIDTEFKLLADPVNNLNPLDLVNNMLNALDKKPEPLIALQKHFNSNQ